MRFWDWGQVDAEWTDWDASSCTFVTVYGPWGHTYDTGEQTPAYFDTSPSYYQSCGSDGSFVYEMLLHIKKDQIKARLGQVPVLVSAVLVLTSTETQPSANNYVVVRRMITTWDNTDWSNWRYDKSLNLYWYLTKNHIVRGQNVEDAILHESYCSHVQGNHDIQSVTITDLVSRALRDNIDIRGHISMKHTVGYTPSGKFVWEFNHPTNNALRAHIQFAYVYPIEFYNDDGSGNLDLSSSIGDNPGEEFYLGSVEPGQTGNAVKAHVRNFSESTQQVEIFDDHPEYTTPITRIGSTTLDYIVLAESAVSQRYTVVFYSGTQYEVQAVAHREYPIDLHSTIDADATWRGAVGTDFTAPEGGLSIPASAWQPGTADEDEYEISVQGNTTDTTWPADSNDQVEIARDLVGSADPTTWRPVVGHREKTRGIVTVNATTKFFPTRRILPAEWPVDNKAFVQNLTTINEGEIASVQEASIGTAAFTGTGNDDATINGNFNGIWSDTVYVKIDSTGSPNTFTWSNDGGSTWEESGVDCSTSPTLLQDGIYVTFAATTGHVLDDYWTSAIECYGIELKSLTANSNVYGSGSVIGTTLPIRDVAAAIFTTVNADSGVSESQPARLYVTSTVGFAMSQEIFIQTPLDPDTAETMTINSVGTGYLDLSAAMTQDYSDGAFVTVLDVGDAAFWLRPVTEETTAEEIKRFRLNARLL